MDESMQMNTGDNSEMNGYVASLCGRIAEEYTIDP